MICLIQTEYSVKEILYPQENVALRTFWCSANGLQSASDIESSERWGAWQL